MAETNKCQCAQSLRLYKLPAISTVFKSYMWHSFINIIFYVLTPMLLSYWITLWWWSLLKQHVYLRKKNVFVIHKPPMLWYSIMACINRYRCTFSVLFDFCLVGHFFVVGDGVNLEWCGMLLVTWMTASSRLCTICDGRSISIIERLGHGAEPGVNTITASQTSISVAAAGLAALLQHHC